MDGNVTAVWLTAYGAVWLPWFLLFGMQRATLLASRRAGIEWRGGGELLLPSWYPLTWLVIAAHWGLLIAMAIFWSWKVALAVLLAGYVLSSILPIPYAMYLGIFQKRVNQILEQDPRVGIELQRMLDEAPF